MNPFKFGFCCLLSLILLGIHPTIQAQHSVARQWSEVLLQAIRDDLARPTVHARNLFHVSIAMYDAWAAYDEAASTFLLGKTWGNYFCPFSPFDLPDDLEAARREAVSYAACRLIQHRFSLSPGADRTRSRCDSLMRSLGYDPNFRGWDYVSGPPAALGNYIARSLIDYGYTDGSNEAEGYANLYYQPANSPMQPWVPYSIMEDPNRWQPLQFDVFMDQSGNISEGVTPAFLSAEWGKVDPFALQDTDLEVLSKEGNDYWIYHDPGPPPLIQGSSGDYQWNFGLVSWWSSHLDPGDSVLWDISPAALGNLGQLPSSASDLRSFYDAFEGGDAGKGHAINPFTGLPYEPNYTLRGDYTRVLAEFWADGPDSETPPGHWYSILNYVHDHPAFERRLRGQGEALDKLAWDVKAYFALGGAMHDAAITAWSIKGYYDYVRPISAIRHMAALGQRTDPSLPNYHPEGIDLVPGLVEQIQPGDSLLNVPGAEVGAIKLKAWRGHRFIFDPQHFTAGVGWIPALDWWPYQRPSFVTPPFAGYVSGHSTYSRAASELLTLLTGDPFFPGGMAEFIAKKDEFLVFEKGPTKDVKLQWATYRDASDQTSLSRIWGGIHPPVDDLPGRIVGEMVGREAFDKAMTYFTGQVESPHSPAPVTAFPNPVQGGRLLHVRVPASSNPTLVKLYDLAGRELYREEHPPFPSDIHIAIEIKRWSTGIYVVQLVSGGDVSSAKILVQTPD